MKIVTIKSGTRKTAQRAERILRESLVKGDIILSGPIPRNFASRFINVVAMVSRKILRGVTHSCVYMGNGQILDIDLKLFTPGPEIEKITIRQFLNNKLDSFGGLVIYVVKPRLYNKLKRQSVVDESMNSFVNKNKSLRHSMWTSIGLAYMQVFKKYRNKKEDMKFGNVWTCGRMVAYIMKKNGIKIGKRATYTFVPMTFLFSKNFKTKSKLIIR